MLYFVEATRQHRGLRYLWVHAGLPMDAAKRAADAVEFDPGERWSFAVFAAPADGKDANAGRPTCWSAKMPAGQDDTQHLEWTEAK